MNDLLTTEEIAKYLRLRRETVIRKAKGGGLPAIKIGRQFRFDKRQVDQWLLQSSVRKVPRVLVVDDEPRIGKLFEEVLQEFGVGVTTAFSGVEAVSLIEKEHFDLAFIDLRMPVIDGNELFARIREIDEQLPIAIITGYPDSALLEKAIQQGPFIVMKKPFGHNDILNAVRTVIHDAVIGRLPKDFG
jgi:excisionase family DNA binding protein